MEVAIFHTEIKHEFCKVFEIKPNNIYKRKRCQNMFPKAFFMSYILPNVNKDDVSVTSIELFFKDLQKLVKCDPNNDAYVQCISLLLKYAALLHRNMDKAEDNPYTFLDWFHVEDVKRVMIWEQGENIDRTMFKIIEKLKFEHIVLGTITSQLVTVSFETLGKCKNLIYYWNLLCDPKQQKPIKLVNETGITERDANKIRQIFEHIRISRNFLDDPISHPLLATLLRDKEEPYRNSLFTFNEKHKPGHKNIYIRISDSSSFYNGLLLFDNKKSKTFEFDYLNSLMLFSLAKDSDYMLVDTIVFRHDLILGPTNHLYDPLSNLINPVLRKRDLHDYSLITQGLNQLIDWSLCVREKTRQVTNTLPKNTFNILQHANEPLATKNDFEKFSTDFSVAVCDSLLYHYQAGDIDFKFKRLSTEGKI